MRSLVRFHHFVCDLSHNLCNSVLLMPCYFLYFWFCFTSGYSVRSLLFFYIYNFSQFFLLPWLYYNQFFFLFTASCVLFHRVDNYHLQASVCFAPYIMNPLVPSSFPLILFCHMLFWYYTAFLSVCPSTFLEKYVYP